MVIKWLPPEKLLSHSFMFFGGKHFDITWMRLRHRHASSNKSRHEKSTRFLTPTVVSELVDHFAHQQGRVAQGGDHFCATELSPVACYQS